MILLVCRLMSDFIPSGNCSFVSVFSRRQGTLISFLPCHFLTFLGDCLLVCGCLIYRLLVSCVQSETGLLWPLAFDITLKGLFLWHHITPSLSWKVDSIWIQCPQRQLFATPWRPGRAMQNLEVLALSKSRIVIPAWRKPCQLQI